MRQWAWLLGLGMAATAWAEPQIASKAVDLRQAMDDLTVAAMNHDMQLVKVQPIDSALVKRGFDDPHVRIAFIASESAVRWAEAADTRLLNLLPLRLSLVQRGDRVVVVTDDLVPWKEEFKNSPGLYLLQAWEVELGLVLKDFAGP